MTLRHDGMAQAVPDPHPLPESATPLPPFEERFPWKGGDLQTLRNRLVHRATPLPGTTEDRIIPLSDGTGDRLLARLDTPEGGGSGPLVVLIHGLMGCDHSAYMWESARFHLTRGRRVLRLNLRGAGPGAKYATNFYYAGCWRDVVDALDAMVPEAPEGFFIVGISLGGSVTLNTLPHLSGRTDIVGAVTVSVPLVPMEAALHLHRPRNVVYEQAFVLEMKRAYRRLGTLTPQMLDGLRRARSVLAVDDAVTGPMHGFGDAASYYAETAGARMIPRITHTPLLLIHAENDPWIPPGPYHALRDDRPPNVALTLTRKGGHVGFHGTHGSEPWFDLRIDAYMRELGL